MSPVPSIDLDHFEAVLFDLDGVLTATAKVHAACWKQAFDEFMQRRAAKNQATFRPFDLKTDYEEYVDGKPRYDGVRSFLESRGIELPHGNPDDPPDRETIDGLGNRKNELINQALESQGVEVFAGSVAWLRQLRQAGIKTAVVSSSKHCQAIIKVAGIADLFDARVDGNVAAELKETARMWYGLGFFSGRREGKFCLHGVTGPDEYTTVVDNNHYTNLIAQNNLSYAAATLKTLQEKDRGLFATIVDHTGLDISEIDEWRRAAELMCLPYDAELQIHPQDDSFLDKEIWDFEHTPMDHYPLLLYYHPLKIYRKQVIKQADVALAMFLLGDKFSLDQKRRNFDYYDPLTTGDSSLSVCIESIMALEIGYLDKALEYAHYAVLRDLEDFGGNVKDGCHMGSMGGSWMLCVYGLAGLRDLGGYLKFHPKLPKGLKRLNFPLSIRGQVLEINVEPEISTYLLREGSQLTIWHYDEKVTLSPEMPRSLRNNP